eukprot:g214.t1
MSADSDAELKTLREIFNLVDADGGGTIDSEELERLMDLVGGFGAGGYDPETAMTMIRQVDTTGTGEVHFDDFVRVVSSKMTAAQAPCSFAQATRAFDTLRGDAPRGMIRPKQLKKALTAFGEDTMAEAEADEYIARLDVKDGFINIEAYLSLCMEQPPSDPF